MKKPEKLSGLEWWIIAAFVLVAFVSVALKDSYYNAMMISLIVLLPLVVARAFVRRDVISLTVAIIVTGACFWLQHWIALGAVTAVVVLQFLLGAILLAIKSSNR